MNGDQLDLGGSFDSMRIPEPTQGAGGEDAGCSARPQPEQMRQAETRPSRVAVCDLTPGTAVRGVYLLSARETRTTKAGKPFFKLKLSDRTGTVDCTVWDTGDVQEDVTAGDLVLVDGRVTEYLGKPQVEATGVTAAPAGAARPRDFLPSTYRDIDELKGFLQFHVGSIYDRDYSALLEAIFGDDEFMDIFITAPAAKLFHHAYLGGLVEHTVSVAEMCDFVAQQYGRVDRDLLMTAALLHDVGKTRELAFDTVIDFTDAGRFLGHVIQGVTLVSEKAREVPGFPEEKLQLLLHCIVSHHGELEWGSPKRPKTIEALILHHVDNLDAKVKGFLEIVDGSRDASWTDLRNLFRRPLHVPRAAHQENDFLPASEDDLPQGM
jgi:3'-5' exoribonuclease